MPVLYSSKQIIKALEKVGFVPVSQKGSHLKMRDKFGKTIIIPTPRKVIFVGTFQKILEQAGLSKSDFETLVKK